MMRGSDLSRICKDGMTLPTEKLIALKIVILILKTQRKLNEKK